MVWVMRRLGPARHLRESLWSEAARRGPRRRCLALPLLTLLLLPGGPLVGGAAGQAVTDAQVQAGIERMRAWLYQEQDPATGSWESGEWTEAQRQPYHATGQTALITYALLLSGESHQSPRLAKAIEFLQNHRVESTYLASMRAHIWAALPDEYLPRLAEEVALLESAMEEGRFHYQPDHPNWSNSLTQYGVLGLWEHRKRGGRVEDRTWEAVGRHMLEQQNDDGGWGYNNTSARGGGKSTASMTSAGVVVLQILQQELLRQEKEANPTMAEAIKRGEAWLDQRFVPGQNEGLGDRYRFYTLYGIERIALAGGISRLNGRDWFESGAQYILEEEAGRGFVTSTPSAEMSRRIATAFALSFLSRGRVPVWVSKLEVPAAAEPAADPAAARRNRRGGRDDDAVLTQRGRRPNDVFFLTRFLSDQRQAELNWQVVSVDEPADDWLRAPVLYWSLPEPVELSEARRQRIKDYLDRGGTLLLNIEGRQDRRMSQWVEELCAGLYPSLELADVEADHPLASLITDLSGGRGRIRSMVQTLSNGARDLVIVPREDWGWEFQAGEPGEGEAWGYMTNLYALVTDRGQLRGRLDSGLGLAGTGPTQEAGATDEPDVEGQVTPPRPTVRLVRGLWGEAGSEDPRRRPARRRGGEAIGAAGNADLEPAVGAVLSQWLERRSGPELRVGARRLDDLAAGGGADAAGSGEETKAPGQDDPAADEATAALLHVTGTATAALSEAELAGVRAWIDGGGTLLVETVGGRGGFAGGVADRLAEELGGRTDWLPADHPIYTGRGLAGSTFDQELDGVAYRGYTLVQGGVGGVQAQLRGVTVGDRLVAVVSEKDLSLGVLGYRGYLVDGYTPSSARELMGRVLAWTAGSATVGKPADPAGTSGAER